MLRIRLRRTGKKHQPSYRIVVADARAKRDGDFVEILGHYNPRANPKEFAVAEDRVKHWLSVGASPSDTVHRLFHAHGLTTAEPPKRVTKQSRAEREAAEAAARAAAEAAAAEAAAASAAAAEAEAAPAEDGEADADAETAE
ncbi:MAG: 30S ribosomal protein S16 [Dehalococcoidia bacterium]